MTDTAHAPSSPTHAIVIGGSMAGLLAARVLSEHFERVTIIERDKLPDTPDIRNGVPQARHLHALLGRGQSTIESLFPGLFDELTAMGSPRVRYTLESRFLTAGGWMKRYDMGIVTNIVYRASFEWLVRKRLSQYTNVQFMTESDVQNLLTDEARATVTGVEVESRADHTTQRVMGNLVIDASGRNSKTPEWLRTLGYDAPPETSVNAFLGYATCLFEMPAERPDWKVIFMNGNPARGINRGAALFEIEGGRWMVTLGGLNKEYPPTDMEGFLEFAKGMAAPDIFEAIKGLKPLTPVYGYRVPGSRQRHYEKLARRPEHFVVIGDAACAFNPLYGQGMTVAALEAVELGKLLTGRDARRLTGFADAFQKQLADTIKNAWLLATGEDLRYPDTEGDKPGFAVRLIQKYVDLLLRAMVKDKVIAHEFIEVQNLFKPPTALFRPDILVRVLVRTLGRGTYTSATDTTGPAKPALKGQN